MSDDLGKYLIAAFVLALAFLAWRAWQVKQASPSWPYVMGEVTSSRPVSRQMNPAEPEGAQHEWMSEVRYRYSVNGQDHTGDRLRAFGRQNLTKEECVQELAPFPVGARVKVYYDPAKPGSSVLIPG